MSRLSRTNRTSLRTASLLVALSSVSVSRGAEHKLAPLHVRMLSTESGVRYGVLDPLPPKFAPTLIVLAGTPENSLGDAYYLQCGNQLRREGFLCVSLDLPCHGADHRPDEPNELAGWSHRLDAGEDIVADFVQRTKKVLDHLIATRATDPSRIAACGTSRGGFMALHLGAQDPRVRDVVAMAPAVRLSVLREFQQMKHPERAEALWVGNLVDQLASRGVWIAIGDRDSRVRTEEAIAFARLLSATAADKKLPPPVDLLVSAEPNGHDTPLGASELSAAWLMRRLKK